MSYDTEIDSFNELFNPSGLAKRNETMAQITGVVGQEARVFKRIQRTDGASRFINDIDDYQKDSVHSIS
jgi:hypothetical protein